MSKVHFDQFNHFVGHLGQLYLIMANSKVRNFAYVCMCMCVYVCVRMCVCVCMYVCVGGWG